MFTGIIQTIGRIALLERRGGDVRIGIQAGGLSMDDVSPGDSIAVNGVCLTAVDLTSKGFSADVSGETLKLTTLGKLKKEEPVNLEKALTLSTRLGGHLVSGHVDGVGTVTARKEDGRSVQFRITAPSVLARYIAGKGSICADGVSLTVNRVEAAEFELNIVPHTLQETTLKNWVPGSEVNLEVDLLARYLERLLLGGVDAPEGSGNITRALLERSGFLSKQ